MKKIFFILCFFVISNSIFCKEKIHPKNPHQRAWYSSHLKKNYSGIQFDSNRMIPTDQRLNIIKTLIPSNPIILESGAYIGDDTTEFSKKWTNARIISFEPNPHAFSQLEKNTKNIKNVERYNLALNSFNGTTNFFAGKNEWEGASSLLAPSKWRKNIYNGTLIDVTCVILDDLCEKNNIDHVDFMWLDMEGAELLVLQSSPKILGKTKVIYTETNFQGYRKNMAQFKDLKKFLEDNNFYLLAHWWLKNSQGDAIFIHKSLL